LLGGKGFHITGDHNQTLPTLYHQVTQAYPGRPPEGQNTPALSQDFAHSAPQAAAILEETLAGAPELSGLRQPLIQAYTAISRCFLSGGTLFIAGNGGSMSDALHISGELDKAYKKARRIPVTHASRLESLPGGAELGASLQVGLRCQVLGINPSLASAVDNDFSQPHMGFAQELYALGRSGDIFLGISTSGNAKNIRYAASTAHLLNLTTIGLTGAGGGSLAAQADIVLRGPATQTAIIQTWHIRLYHCLCEMLEAQIFASEEAA
jgi:D-sedoheptulose 7-phosphate isomerase